MSLHVPGTSTANLLAAQSQKVCHSVIRPDFFTLSPKPKVVDAITAPAEHGPGAAANTGSTSPRQMPLMNVVMYAAESGAQEVSRHSLVLNIDLIDHRVT